MQYLVFGILLILGAVGIGLFLYLYHGKNIVEAIVVESYCDIKRNEQMINSIKVTHVFEFESGDERKRIETALFPVRELNSAKVSLYYNRKTDEVYVPEFTKYFTVLSTFFLAGAISFVLYWFGSGGQILLQDFGGSDWLAFLLGVVAVVSFSHVVVLINPAVLKTKGNFEGILKPDNSGSEAEVYSLWYGEHRQYAKRMNGMLLKPNPEKAVTLLFNTKTGYVSRLHEFVISMCVSMAAFLAMIVVLLIF